MLERIHKNTRLQLVLGLVMGLCFGFLLQRGGVTRYEVIIGQLLLRDWTVVKIMLMAIIVGMAGVYLLHAMGLAKLHKKPGSVGRTVVGGLIFGVGFGVLGYCPGTLAGAVGQGSIDALIGGVLGMLLGAYTFALIYPRLKDGFLRKGSWGEQTLPQLLGLPATVVVPVAVVVLAAALWFIERVVD